MIWVGRENLMTKKIEILLSCYNGESYVREQLESYVRLNNFCEVAVLIRDDGSCDGTLDILKEYEKRYGFRVIAGENIGLAASLHELITKRDRDCEYFAFSDQDDVWLPDKLESAIEFIEQSGNVGPIYYAAMSKLVDGSLNEIGSTFKPKKELSFYNAMIQNVCIGHTTVFNEDLAKLLEREYSSDILVTDSWTYLLASAAGGVIFEPKETALYRQHGNNVIGYETSGVKSLFMRLKRALTTRKAEQIARQLRAFVKCYGDIIPEEYKREAERFLSGGKNFFTRLAYIFTTKAYRQTLFENLVFKLMYVLGKYKIKNKITKQKEQPK